MSWFDASGLASIAKSALKEAQRTIDKALDIKDEIENNDSNGPKVASHVDTNSEDFFNAWSEDVPAVEKKNENSDSVLEPKPEQPLVKGQMTSIWGSFTGSFFDNAGDAGVNKAPPIDRMDSLDDSTSANQHFSSSKLVVHSPSEEQDADIKNEAISDSVELITPLSGNLTECTSSPESDLLISEFSSQSHSTSKPSESVAVIGTGDSLTSPSSVEILSFEELESPIGPDLNLVSPCKTSPDADSVEIIPMEEQEEDTASFASVSETTVLDQDSFISITAPSAPEKTITKAPCRQNITLDLIKTSTSNVIDIPRPMPPSNATSTSNTTTTTARSQTQANLDLKILIADAMTNIPLPPPPPPQQQQITEPRENSPTLTISSGSGEMVKIGSSDTDEFEATTTSSDIEIISLSSPNGNGHTSKNPKVASLVKRGHVRELSETSSIGDCDHNGHEPALVELGRRNTELTRANAELERRLARESSSVAQLTEDYTQRLSALEEKLQRAIGEKDAFKKQVEVAKREVATRPSKGELEAAVSDKDDVIAELRAEGEKLSKQQLQHSNIIKKLRAKEKENEGTIKNLKETIEDLSKETDRLKRSLAAKDEVERNQIEAVHQLTAKTKKIETENNRLQSQLDDLTQKYDTAKKSLDAAKKELMDKNRTSSELVDKEHKLESLENEKRMTESQNAAIIGDLEDLRAKLRDSESTYAKKDQVTRREISDLLRRLEEAEARNEELSQSVLEVSKPLVRQLESFQATHALKVASFEKIEQELQSKINELQARLQSSQNTEHLVKQESSRLSSKLSEVGSELESLQHKYELAQMELNTTRAQQEMSQRQLELQVEDLQEKLRIEKHKVDELTRDAALLQEQLSALEKSSNKNVAMARDGFVGGTVKSGQDESLTSEQVRELGSNSPTLSLGKQSVSESLTGSLWSQDDGTFMDNASTPRFTNMFEMQMLQTNLRQREGEVQQLQWELNRREQERSLLNSEISTLLTRTEIFEALAKDHDELKTQFQHLQQQYDTMCQLFGEKVEQNEELKLDLQDVKDMYKSQIDELLNKPHKSKS